MRVPLGLLSACLLAVGCSGGDGHPTQPSSTSAPSPAPAPLWSRSGVGNQVFDKPENVSRLLITGDYRVDGSDFVVWCGNRLLVNEIVGRRSPSPTYQGTHDTADCLVVSVRNSAGVAWSMTEVR